MKGALDKHAEIIYAKLTTDRQLKICELMFRALTDKAADVRGIRRPTSIEDLCELTIANTEEVISIVEIFRARGCTFLMPPPDVPLTDKSIIDISHESLMRIWKRLIQWTEEEAKSGSVYLELSRDALRYDRKEIGFLWIDPQLANGLKWKEEYKPTAKWAERYNSDFETAMDYLKKSDDKALADKAEKERLIILEQERKEADAKRIKEEEDRKRKRKITRASFAVLIFILCGSIFFAIEFKKQEGIATDKAKEAVDSATVAKLQRFKADSLKKIADKNAQVAGDSAISAQQQRIIADSLRKKAEEKTIEAQDSTIVAQDQRQIAIEKENEALKQKEIAKTQNYLSAPNEYARLIREVPTEIKKIKEGTFDYKLIAYCNHLDTLKRLTKDSLKDNKVPLADYNSLKEKLYNNNDLYEKLYYCFKKFNREDFVTDKSKDTNDLKHIFPKEPKIASKKDQLTIYATIDNYINVSKLGENQKNISEIPMGTQVTALDYNEEKNIIYFGTKNGDIGFIKYANDKKNQPVFQNSLYSDITATKFFQEDGRSYLLVTGRKSRPVFYLLDKDYLPNKNLIGNVYPEKISNEVIDAEYDSIHHKIKLFTRAAYGGNTITYIWDPFSDELLKEMKMLMKVTPGDKNYEKLAKMMEDPKIKIY